MRTSKPVAQIGNLPYRRMASCRAAATSGAFGLSDAQPITNRRYGRVQLCATPHGMPNTHLAVGRVSGRRRPFLDSEVALYQTSTWRFRGSASIALLLFAAMLASSAHAADASQAQLEFFENKIRPIFAEHCFKCHSPAKGKVKGGLELDWKGGWEKGGDTGPAIVAGAPEKSLLIKAVRYGDPDLQMPPKGEKLTESQINDLAVWIKMGAPDPRTTRPTSAPAEYTGQGKNHWAFQPVKKPAPPAVQNGAWIKNEVDRFILAKLESNGLAPNGPADKRTLIRRVYFDLIGLPPSPEEVAAFLQDGSSKAFEKIVDQLLASPRYGERWGRHWLDVVRYSDTKGQVNRQRESSIFPYAWTYRDYVIKAFNDDKPYDRFVIEQLAADKVKFPTRGGISALSNDPSSDPAALAALGFLTVGDRFNGNMGDILNDRIDVTTKAFLGLTVSCARCHDHKFDPIPQADYYSLHGIFASSVEPLAKPAINSTNANPKYDEYLAKRAEIDGRILNVRTQNMAAVFGDYKRLAGVYLFATQMPANEREAYLEKSGADSSLLKNWEQIARGGGRPAASIFGVWTALSRIPKDKFAEQARRQLANLDRNNAARQWSPYVVQAFRNKAPRTLAEVAAMYGSLFASNEPAWQTTLSALLSDTVLRLLPNTKRGEFLALRDQSDILEMVHPGTPPRAMVLVDSPTPKDSPIFLRGEAENLGAIVPRRFLEVLSGTNRPAFKSGSGRPELAYSIANKNNPLTARVLVNRVWLHHFGEGFITTPDDFGNQSAPPSHPELLDYLASRFMEDGWSLKKLHKQIVLSAAYQQSSQNNPVFAEKDPSNRLLWRANVRRLELEPLRDSLLQIGGNLDLTVGGHPVDLSEGTHRPQGRAAMALNRLGEYRLPTATRRTVYGYVDRADVVELLSTFDFASPDMPMGKRYETTVPQQALFLMNSPLVIEQVRRVVDRDAFKAQTTDEDRIRFLYELFFQRLPIAEEIRHGVEFVAAFQTPGSVAAQTVPSSTVATGGPVNKQGRPVKGQKASSSRNPKSPPKPLNGWQEYAHALLLTNEASFVN
jgi:mono/diheme cytochrome c family protein